MEHWGVREFLHAVELLIQMGSIAERRRVLRRELNQQDFPSPNSICRWEDSGVKKAVSQVKSHLLGRPQFAHSRILPECLHPSAAVQGNLHLSMLQH
jgi:hypothetical protein